jgi:hypothetical protein
MSQVTLQGNASGTGVFTVAAPNSNTSRTLTLPDATGTVVTTDATQTLTNKSISGAQINSGTVAAARLGSGTPGTGNFLRGDGSWQTVPASAPSTTDVLNATAGATAGAVGTYAFCTTSAAGSSNPNFDFGSTHAGSSIRFTGYSQLPAYGGISIVFSPTIPSGTWRCLGHTSNARVNHLTLFLRIS